MENKELIGIIIPTLAGTFAILASIFNWNFFFENRKATLFVRIFGQNGARIFYSALGILLYFLAYLTLSK